MLNQNLGTTHTREYAPATSIEADARKNINKYFQNIPVIYVEKTPENTTEVIRQAEEVLATANQEPSTPVEYSVQFLKGIVKHAKTFTGKKLPIKPSAYDQLLKVARINKPSEVLEEQAAKNQPFNKTIAIHMARNIVEGKFTFAQQNTKPQRHQ